MGRGVEKNNVHDELGERIEPQTPREHHGAWESCGGGRLGRGPHPAPGGLHPPAPPCAGGGPVPLRGPSNKGVGGRRRPGKGAVIIRGCEFN